MTVLNRRFLEMSNVTNNRSQGELKASPNFKEQKMQFSKFMPFD